MIGLNVKIVALKVVNTVGINAHTTRGDEDRLSETNITLYEKKGKCELL